MHTLNHCDYTSRKSCIFRRAVPRPSPGRESARHSKSIRAHPLKSHVTDLVVQGGSRAAATPMPEAACTKTTCHSMASEAFCVNADLDDAPSDWRRPNAPSSPNPNLAAHTSPPSGTRSGLHLVSWRQSESWLNWSASRRPPSSAQRARARQAHARHRFLRARC